MARIKHKVRGNRQAGQALYLTAMSLVVLTGFLGLGIDMGAMRYEKRLEQTAADAAAIAGASDLQYDSVAGVSRAAMDAAATNGFQDNDGGIGCGSGAPVGTVCVQVNDPPSSGPHSTASPGQYVEVVVSAVHPTYFMRIFGVTKETVTARAVATDVGSGPNNPCLLALSASATALVVNGTINLTACNLIVNGNLQVNGTINKDSSSSIEVAGTCAPAGACTGVVTGVPAIADPVANLSTPPADGCTNGGLLGILNVLNFCNGTIATSVSLDLSQLSNPGGLYIISGASGLTLQPNATLDASGQTVYSPNGITLKANSSVTAAAAIIVDQPLTVDASVTLNLGGSASSVIKNAVLVE